MSDLYWEDDEILECHNHCDWRGPVSELDNPEEDFYCCPKCGASTSMILSAPTQVLAAEPGAEKTGTY